LDRPDPEIVAATASGSLGPGDQFGRRYEIARLLGEGGTGAVYLARDHELAREVALEVIAPRLASEPAVLERVKRRLQLSSVVTHPNVLRVYDLGESDGLKFVTMQFIDGQTLEELLRHERPLPIERAAALFRQVCAGVAAAHEKGVLHLDLKPRNVMVDAAGTAYVTDFGQVDRGSADARSDVFGLGVILREMVAGTPPPGVPPALQGVLDRCLAVEPEARYGSAAEVVAALDAIARPARRRRLVRWPVVAGTALVALAAAGWWVSRPRPDHEPVSVVLADFDNRSGDAAFDHTVEPILKIALEDAHLPVLDRDNLHRSLAAPPPERLDERAAREIAVRQGVGVVVTGSLTLEGGRYQLSLKALDAMTGGVIAAVQDGASSKTRVLELAPKLAAGLRRSLRDGASGRPASGAPGSRDGRAIR
jgi:serine/threonine-protein kinase